MVWCLCDVTPARWNRNNSVESARSGVFGENSKSVHESRFLWFWEWLWPAVTCTSWKNNNERFAQTLIQEPLVMSLFSVSMASYGHLQKRSHCKYFSTNNLRKVIRFTTTIPSHLYLSGERETSVQFSVQSTSKFIGDTSFYSIMFYSLGHKSRSTPFQGFLLLPPPYKQVLLCAIQEHNRRPYAFWPALHRERTSAIFDSHIKHSERREWEVEMLKDQKRGLLCVSDSCKIAFSLRFTLNSAFQWPALETSFTVDSIHAGLFYKPFIL